MERTSRPCLVAACCALVAAIAGAQEALSTRWAQDVSPELVHAEHPRPLLVRDSWVTLNGLWDYAVRPRHAGRPEAWDGEILVPFPIESSLSGVARRLTPDERLWYRTSFAVPASWEAERVVLRFGAVDWQAEVWVDGRRAGLHEGGYDPFAFEVGDLLTEGGEHELVVAVWDPTDTGEQPRGKQVLEPHGIWYTPVSGIWQTVWLEGLPAAAIEAVRVTEPQPGRVRIAVAVRDLPPDVRLEAVVSLAGEVIARAGAAGTEVELELAEPRRWSPSDPALYDLELRLLDPRDDPDRVLDSVKSYFALRTVEVLADAAGVPRIHLNGEPLFQLGLLDQGWWPDGLYTAPTDEALRYDLEVTKRLGFNMVRKHVKVEPARWYAHCDRLGLLVWQDMPSGGPYIGPADPDAERTPASAAAFERELEAMVANLCGHPSIVLWVLFNEGWGQYDTARLAARLRELDPTRLVDAASGWTDRGVGDVFDLHRYPGPAMPAPEPDSDPPRAAVLGEFGGLGLPLPGHTWQDEENWGYRSFETQEATVAAYVELVDRLLPLIARGLAAAVYTQTTDVEIEVNGVMTYDRAVLKLDDPRVLAANRRVYLPPPRFETVLPTAREAAGEWRYTSLPPPAGWERPRFDDAGWATGPGGFGTRETPGAVVGTEWSRSDVWLRRTFELETVPDLSGDAALCLEIHHDEDARVFLNGALVAELEGYSTDYVHVALEGQARARLASGTNVLAVHCRQTAGGQFIDVGLVVRREAEPTAR